MNTDKIYAEKLAGEYAPKGSSKIVQLKKLDRKAKRPSEIFAFTFGTVMALILGFGICISLGAIGSGTALMTVAGAVIGLTGIIGVTVNYPVYKRILESGKQKYAFEIVELAKQISDGRD